MVDNSNDFEEILQIKNYLVNKINIQIKNK